MYADVLHLQPRNIITSAILPFSYRLSVLQLVFIFFSGRSLNCCCYSKIKSQHHIWASLKKQKTGLFLPLLYFFLPFRVLLLIYEIKEQTLAHKSHMASDCISVSNSINLLGFANIYKRRAEIFPPVFWDTKSRLIYRKSKSQNKMTKWHLFLNENSSTAEILIKMLK